MTSTVTPEAGAIQGNRQVRFKVAIVKKKGEVDSGCMHIKSSLHWSEPD